MKAYCFLADNNRLNDGRKIKVGTTHKVGGVLVPLRNGIHASKHVADALVYSQGPELWRVELGGEVVRFGDNMCAREATYLANFNASKLLEAYMITCARDVAHLWDAPDIITEYFESGDESLRQVACDEAKAIAMSGFGARAIKAVCDSWYGGAGGDIVMAIVAARSVGKSADWGEIRKKQRRRLARMVNDEFKRLS